MTGRPQPIRHGTDGGYMAHRRRGSTPCDECRFAHAQAMRWANKVAQRRATLALRWLRDNAPDVWADICAQARHDVSEANR